MYLAASTRSQVATAQHGDHGFPKCGILCPDIRDPIAVPFHHFKKYAIRKSFAVFILLTPLFFPEFLGSNDKKNVGIWLAQMTKGMAAYDGQGIYRACRPRGGRQAPVARWGATGPFFSREVIANLKKKITLKACRLMGELPGVFLKYFKTDIYF